MKKRRESSNCKQTAENQLTKSKETADKCKQIAESVNKQLKV